MLIQVNQIKHGVLALLREGPLTATEITRGLVAQKRSFVSDLVVGKHLDPMTAFGLLDRVDGKYGLTIDGHMRLTELDRKGKPDKSLCTPARSTSVMTGLYDGAELRRNPGIDEARFKAFTLPSVALGWRTWPDGRKEQI
jgi:hypothetical protein